MPISQTFATSKKHGYRRGYYYFANAVGSPSSLLIGGNTVRFALFSLKSDITIDRLSIEVITAASGANAKAAIFLPSTITDGIPGGRIISTASLDCSTTGIKVGTVADTFLKAGDYYSAVFSSSSALALRGCNNVPIPPEYLIGTAGEAFNSFTGAFIQSNIADMPSSFSEANSLTNRAFGLVKFRVKP